MPIPLSNDGEMNDTMRYALEIKKLMDIAMRDDLDIELRLEINTTVRRLHELNIALFERYMNAAKRLSMYE